MAVLGAKENTLPQIALTQSQTFIMPQDGNVCIHVVGAGASGKLTSSGAYAFAGGAGGYCKKNSLAVTKGGSFTVVVGVGGPRMTNEAQSVNYYNETAYCNGGDSTVAGPGLSATLTAEGGGGDSTSANRNYAAGGASNGDVNNAGGRGYFSGGGAVGVYGAGQTAPTALNGGAVYWPRGALSDAEGDPSLSGFGQILGGKGGVGASLNGNVQERAHPSADRHAGWLAGGGSVWVQTVQTGTSGTFYGGDATIGGGGGMIKVASTGGQFVTGKGGDGIVLIQYLPL